MDPAGSLPYKEAMHWKTTLAISGIISSFESSVAFVLLERTVDRSSRSRRASTFQVRNALQFSNDEGNAKRIKLVSIDLEKNRVHQIIQNTGGGAAGAGWKTNDGAFVEQTHVTMAFCQGNATKQIEIQERFGPVLGCQVDISVHALLWNEQVAALAVTVVSNRSLVVDGQAYSIPAHENAFPHVTVWVAADASAYLSNQLVGLTNGTETRRFDLSDPVKLIGTLSFWGDDNEPLLF
jgi:hypothetical protein